MNLPESGGCTIDILRGAKRGIMFRKVVLNSRFMVAIVIYVENKETKKACDEFCVFMEELFNLKIICIILSYHILG